MNITIQDFHTTPLTSTRFIRPLTLHYKQNGQSKTWEAVKSFDSVCTLLFHKEKKSFLLVKQFRPPVFLNDKTKAYTYELCAGIIDKDKPLAVIAKEEIYEECGYDVPIEKIERITSFYTNVGVSGAKQTLFFALIDESMNVNEGGGIEEEAIERVWISLEEYERFIFDETIAKTPGLMFAFLWYMKNRSS